MKPIIEYMKIRWWTIKFILYSEIKKNVKITIYYQIHWFYYFLIEIIDIPECYDIALSTGNVNIDLDGESFDGVVDLILVSERVERPAFIIGEKQRGLFDTILILGDDALRSYFPIILTICDIDALFSGLNYDGPDEFEEDGEPVFEVRLLMDSKIDIDEIYPAIIKIVECCNKHNVAYDGWGVNFLDEDE